MIKISERIKNHWDKILLLLTLAFWIISVASRIIKSGYVYGLNFELFQPDGGNYLKLTQDFSNFDFQTSSVYSWTRPLYPILSVPFYELVGINGMLVIPSLSLLFIGILFQYVSKVKKDRVVLLFCFLVITSSSTVLRWSVADLTDSLHLTMFALCAVGLYRNWTFKTLLIVVLLGALARPMGPIWTALFLPFISGNHGKKRREFVFLTITPTLLFLINTLLMIKFGGFAPSSKSLMQQVIEIPLNFLKLIFVEFGQIAVLDRVLFYSVIATLVLAITDKSDKWTRAHLYITIASFLVSAWIGVLGVNFRYQLPMLVSGSLVTLNFMQKRVYKYFF